MQVKGTLSLSHNQQQFTEKRIELLRQIDRHGSVSAAAKAMGLSYKGAWDMLETIHNLSGKELVSRVTGGKGGGGSVVTEEGKRLLHVYDLFADAHNRFLDLLSQHIDNPQDAYDVLQRIGMKTSARNQLSGEVTRIRHGSVNDEVTVRVNTTDEIIAVVTKESVESMDLAIGKKVFALIKASSILLATDEPRGLSARNVVKGTVERIVQGGVNAEVVLVLPGQTRLAAVITRESVERLALGLGDPAWMFFKASSVILGV